MHRRRFVLAALNLPFLTFLPFGKNEAAAQSSSSAQSPAVGDGAITPLLNASRTRGIAPFGVHFDATGTTSTRTTDHFREIVCSFDYGDPNSGKWAVSGLSKNVDAGGPMGAHVYETPGVYTVTFVANDGTGQSRTTVEITVLDADKEFAGAKTICVDTTGGKSGGPAGAVYQTSIGIIASDRRYLLKRGQTFGAVALPQGASNFQIGAYGSGKKPVISNLSVSSGKGGSRWAFDYSIRDVEITRSFSLALSTRRATLLRVDFDAEAATENKIEIAPSTSYFYNAWPEVRSAAYYPKEIFLCEVDARQASVPSKPTPNCILIGTMTRSALLGCYFDKANQHSLRFGGHKVVIAHCLVGGEHNDGGRPPGIRLAIKLQSIGLDKWSDMISESLQPALSHFIVRNNIIGTENFNGSWLFSIGPQYKGAKEGLEDVIVENNEFVYGNHTNTAVAAFGRRITARSNTRKNGGSPRLSALRWLPDELTNWDGPYYGFSR